LADGLCGLAAPQKRKKKKKMYITGGVSAIHEF